MQTDKNNMKVEQSVSIHSHALERPWKRQIVTDPKIAQHITNFNYTFIDLCNVKVPFLVEGLYMNVAKKCLVYPYCILIFYI